MWPPVGSSLFYFSVLHFADAYCCAPLQMQLSFLFFVVRFFVLHRLQWQ
ncbi:hypothetical protein OH687_37000 [Burkholderia anthina]|nr:hypothetical protein OH687_37000 [Burkholderia anthina]